MVIYACELMRMCVEFQDEDILRGEECETPKKKKKSKSYEER